MCLYVFVTNISMSIMPKKYITLNLEPELVEDIRKIAEKEDVPITWSQLAKNALYMWVALHRARGATD